MRAPERIQRAVAQVVAVLIAVAALVLTYVGTATFCHDHGAPGWRGYTIAAMNDLIVLTGLVWPERPLQALAGLCAAFTVWANLAHAAEGLSGLIVALIPPALAILLVWALEVVAHKPHAETVSREPVAEPMSHEPEPQLEPEDEPFRELVERLVEPEPNADVSLFVDQYGNAQYQREPLHLVDDPTTEPEGGWTQEIVAQRIKAHGWTTAQAVEYTGKSKATINRWKREAA